ncbi:MAG: LacI family transcriptional regulator [Firmicutes bacterium HGW-Firmicutes-7]|nr:MAG: LacI family transcriptional regulator [Firmicutes bacterium HGW-Firmicutes-7]
MSVTIRDIAKIAGVSPSTVSRCLNDSTVISEKTKKRIKQIAEELGFEFNANARSLSTSKTGTVGIIYPENYTELDDNLYFNSLHNQLRDSLEREDLDLIAAFPVNKYTNKSNIQKLITCKKVDGLIIVHSKMDTKTFDLLNKSKIPYVFLHHFPEICKEEDVDVVYTDHFIGGYLATEHLINMGHKKIICVSTMGDEDEFKLRTEGYKKALLDYNIEYDDKLLFYGDHSYPSGYRIVYKNFEVFKGVSAVFAQTDLMAFGIMDALREKNIKVPNDMAIVGYNDIELCTCVKPNLTTIHQPREEIAHLTCERLIDLMNAKKPKKSKKIIIQPRLIIRDSCGANKI